MAARSEQRMPRPGGPADPPIWVPAHSSPLPVNAAAAPPLDAAPAPGTRIGQYELIRELGRGGMGAVFAARDTKLGRKVAIKFLSAQHPDLGARFLLEARATARCSHENIIVIHEVGEYDGNPFMVLEYLQGAPLSTLLRDGKPRAPVQAIELIVPVVRALNAAHAHNIVHRDLKPDNIFLTDSGIVKVLDFGIAKLIQRGDHDGPGLVKTMALHLSESGGGDRPDLTQRGALVGTLPYMSPEQWGSGGPVDAQTDVWAVGIILFEMVSGHHPLAPRAGWDLMVTGVLGEPMPNVRNACPNIPDDLADVIDHCLQKPKDRRIGSACELLDALEPMLPGRSMRRLRSHESPYAGLKSFQEADAHRFFGRARDVAAAVARLRDVPLVGIAGPSGVGKSSFVRAGVLPALKASGEEWTTVVVRPGRNPMTALAYALSPMLTTGAGNTANTIAQELARDQQVVERLYGEPGYLGTALRSRARARGQHILLFVDQFEELFTQVADPSERKAFTACLAGVCDDVATPLRLVLSVRSDFLDHMAEAPALMAELTRGLLFLAPPDRDGLRDALIQPAEMAGYQFELPQIVEAMLDHLQHTPGALPLLQFAASQLWEMRDRDRRLLTAASYERIGGITGSLASHAAAVLAECTPREQALVRAICLRLVTSEHTRAIVPVSELYELSPDPAEVHRVVDRLVHSRLLVSQTATSDHDSRLGGTVELVHESLIHSWPMLRRWLDETQEDSAFLEQLRTAAKQWLAKGYPQGLLWRGEAAEEARLWHRRYRGELPDLQRTYLLAVYALDARAARRKRIAVTSALAIMALLVLAAGVGLVTIRDAQREAAAQARHAQDQLTLTQAAEASANQERAKTTAANRELAGKNQELVAAVAIADRARAEAERARIEAERTGTEAVEARARAEQSKRRERRSRKRATEAARIADEAAENARRASERLEEALDKERQRVQELETLARGTKIIQDVRTTSGASPR